MFGIERIKKSMDEIERIKERLDKIELYNSESDKKIKKLCPHDVVIELDYNRRYYVSPKTLFCKCCGKLLTYKEAKGKMLETNEKKLVKIK